MSSLKPNKFQQLVIAAKGNVLVNASAGSGKTSTMIRKIMSLLIDEHADIKKILVITFTVAAAAEMKQKLVNEIYKSSRQGSAQFATLQKQLENVPFANISTIDSFCYGIFRKYFALIKRDPSCVLLDPDDASNILKDTIDRVCEEYIAGNDAAFFDLAKHFTESRRLDKLKDAIKKIYYFITKREDFDLYRKEVLESEENEKRIADYFRAYLDKEIARLSGEASNYMRWAENDAEEKRRAYNFYCGLEKTKNVAEPITCLESFLNVCAEGSAVYNSIKYKKKIEDKKAFYILFSDAENEFKPYYECLKKPYDNSDTKKLVEATLKVQDEYSSYKAKKNLVDLDDLKHYALEILKDGKAREEIRNSFDYIFVDEYQDTDYLQEKMLGQISKNDNVFVVGDIKQSIYRFRHAEPKIFQQRMRQYDSLKTGQNIPLSTNYRSDQRVLDFVNDVCKEIMTDAFCGIDYQSTSMLTAGKTFEKVSEEPPCAVYTYTDNGDKHKRKGYYSVKNEIIDKEEELEGVFIARKIKELVNNLDIFIPEKGKRKVEYKDIAILGAKRNIFKERGILDALDKAGVPYNLDESEKKRDPDREVLVDFLRILTNMAQDIPLANVLCSKLTDFTTGDLLKIRRESAQVTFWQSFVGYSGDDALRKKIDEFLTFLNTYRFKMSYMKVSDLLVEAMSRGYDAYLLSKGEQCIAKINSFINFIAARKENDSVEEFIEYYDNSYDGNKTSVDTNAVTITTIHKSKGLEYPIVIIAGADSKINTDQFKEKFLTDNDFGIAVKRFDDEAYRVEDTFATKVFRLKLLAEARQEHARLFYVGVTRAQNHLIVTGEVPKKNDKQYDVSEANSFMDFLLYAKQQNANLDACFRDMETDIEAPAAPKKEEVCAKSPDLSALDEKYKYLAETKHAAKYSVSEIVDNDDNKVKKLFERTDAITGINYHAVMQYIDFKATTKEAIEREIVRLVEENVLTEEEANSLDIGLLERVMNSEIMALARENKALREQPFMLYTDTIGGEKLTDKVLVQGVIDLLILDDDVTLVDFKVSFGDPNYLKEKYSAQLNLYSEAVEKIMKQKVGRKVLFNILKGETVTVE
ncbi:MAG TPA: UvrD-helicase domain-containing protein [Clostridia bacterium]|nr:UvrD-helicase domain-containing protein [Clostridia bacterium]